MSRTTWISTAGGLVFGLALLSAAFSQARLGHGTYTIWAVASLPALVLGLGQLVAPVMFVLLGLQWAAIGLCISKTVTEKSPLWSLGALGIGVAYIAASVLGHERLRDHLDGSTAHKAAAAGLAVGIVMIVGALLMAWLAAARRRQPETLPPAEATPSED